MKSLYFFMLVSFLFFSQTVFAETPASTNETPSSCTITTTLRIGSSGEQVKCLQLIVGATADGHFGPLTRASVVKWQVNKGLFADGVVGPLTRATLNATIAGGYPSGCNSNTTYSATTGKKCDEKENPTTGTASPVVIPGTSLAVGSKMPESLKDPQKNLEAYIASVKKGLTERGESENTISIVEENIRNEVAKKPNTLQQFFNDQIEIYNKKIRQAVSNSPARPVVDRVFSFLSKTFLINSAQASGALPFGGFITAVYSVCTCSEAVQQLFVSLPSAPTGISNMTLNYVEGTQAFLNYNIPEVSIAVLGFYEPGVQSCYMTVSYYCVVIPATGQIMPTVGSSLAP